MGEFALLDTTLDCGKKLNIFAVTETEDMDNIARDYQFYVREVMFYQNLRKLNVKTPKPYYVEHDEESGRVLLLLEFMDGWYNPDQIEEHLRKRLNLQLRASYQFHLSFGVTSTS